MLFLQASLNHDISYINGVTHPFYTLILLKMLRMNLLYYIIENHEILYEKYVIINTDSYEGESIRGTKERMMLC